MRNNLRIIATMITLTGFPLLGGLWVFAPIAEKYKVFSKLENQFWR